MLHHVTLSTVDLDALAGFYRNVLGALGIEQLREHRGPDGTLAQVGFGSSGLSFFWLAGGRSRASMVHVAFAASSRQEVDAFHKAALDAGGVDNGPPGYRPNIHPDYYAAFSFDPDGNNIEAVWFDRRG